MTQKSSIIIRGINDGATVGIWLGATGRAGAHFQGFRNLRVGECVLIRVDGYSGILVPVTRPCVVLQFDSSTGTDHRLVNVSINGSIDDRSLVDAGFEGWDVDSDDLKQMNVPVLTQLSRMSSADQDFSFIPIGDIKSKILSPSTCMEGEHLFVAQMETCFALFACCGNLACLEMWTKHIKLLEWICMHLSDKVLSCLTRELMQLDSDSLDDDHFNTELKRCLCKILYKVDDRAPFQDLFNICNSLFAGVHEELERLYDDEEEDAPTVVESVVPTIPLNEASVKSSASDYSKSSSTNTSQNRMEWML
jgi:hypothetical protein